MNAFSDMAYIKSNLDFDPQETEEWCQALLGVIANSGREREPLLS